MPLIFSYQRFSSEKQSRGGSLNRQKTDAEKYCDEHNLVLETRQFVDPAISAWKGKNVSGGKLGLFLSLVEDGTIPSDSWLLVEALDRVSRMKVMDALALFNRIINLGITLVTLSNGHKFSKERLDEEWHQLIYAISEMAAANKENELKSDRVTKKWTVRRDAAIADASHVMTAKVPLWINVIGARPSQTFELNAERAALVRRIVDMSKAGNGNHTIIKTLHAEGVAAWMRSAREKAKRDEEDRETGREPQPKVWEPAYIQKMLTQRALYGAVEVKGGTVIEQYYPPIMDEQEYIYLQALRSDRAKSKRTNRQGEGVTNLFSGLLTCGYCQNRMGITGYKTKKPKALIYRYIACHGARLGTSKCRMNGWSLQEFEDDMLMFITSIDYGRLVGRAPSTIETERAQLANVSKQITDGEQRVLNLGKAIEATDSPSLFKRLVDLEAALVVLKGSHEKQAKKVASLASQDGGSKGRVQALIRIYRLMKNAESSIERRALREQLSTAINQAVKQIVMYPVGRIPQGSKADRFLDVTFVNGATKRAEGVEVAPKELVYLSEN